jgi:hypothetical protein
VSGIQLYDDGKHTGAMPGRILHSAKATNGSK